LVLITLNKLAPIAAAARWRYADWRLVKALMLKLAVVALVAGGVLLLYSRFTGSLTATEARELVARGALLVDVRTPEEFAAGHIKGALNIPLGELPQRASELGRKSTPIVLYCRSGARSGRALELLKQRGFRQAQNLGAMSRW